MSEQKRDAAKQTALERAVEDGTVFGEDDDIVFSAGFNAAWSEQQARVERLREALGGLLQRRRHLYGACFCRRDPLSDDPKQHTCACRQAKAALADGEAR